MTCATKLYNLFIGQGNSYAYFGSTNSATLRVNHANEVVWDQELVFPIHLLIEWFWPTAGATWGRYKKTSEHW